MRTYVRTFVNEFLQLYGARFRINADDPAALSVLQNITRHFAFEHISEVDVQPDVSIDFATSEYENVVPPEATRGFDLNIGLQIWWHDGCLYALNDHACLQIDHSRSKVLGCVHPGLSGTGAAQSWFLALLIVTASIILARKRMYMAHAAALANASNGVLLIANSDCGKSTISYSLVKQGWQYVSDDSIFLRSDGKRIEALAFRRKFGLDTEAGELFPELAKGWEYQNSVESKWSVAIEELYPSQKKDTCTPSLLVFPEIVDRPTSELAPMNKIEAMHAVLMQSSTAFLEPRLAPMHLEVLKQLVNQTRHYRLRAGRDLKANPALVASMFDDLLSVAPS